MYETEMTAVDPMSADNINKITLGVKIQGKKLETPV